MSCGDVGEASDVLGIDLKLFGVLGYLFGVLGELFGVLGGCGVELLR